MLILFYCLLFILYAGLVLTSVFFRNTRPDRLEPWPVLNVESEDTPTRTSCQKDDDCSARHVCLNQTCVPKLLRGDHCRAPTGEWKEHQYRGATFAVCTCTLPEFYTQAHFGGNCNIPIGCGLYGRYDLHSRTCECDPGYEEVGRTCVKARALRGETSDENDRVPVRSDFFHPDYIARWEPKVDTLKRPCSFDMMTGRPLKNAKYDPESGGCLCDPRYGQFGVRVPDKTYLRGSGYDGCASIFARDPDTPQEVILYEFFYLGDGQKPVAFILFKNVEVDSLVSHWQDYLKEVYRKRDGGFDPFIASLMVGQEWPHDYGQYVLKGQHVPYTARTRACPVTNFGILLYCDEWAYHPNYHPDYCFKLADYAMKVAVWPRRSDQYNLMYRNPVCITKAVDGIERYVLNPYQIEEKSSPNLLRFNGLSIHYQSKKDVWVVDMEEYNIDQYFNLPCSVCTLATKI